MGEYISRKETLENLKRFAPEHITPLIEQLIMKQPAADVVEGVRCGKCRHWLETGYDPLLERKYGHCYNTDTPFQCESRACTVENCFCCWGELKE